MNYNEVFKCTICYLDYEKSIRRPMIICRNHHTICEVCLDKICDKSDFAFNCPICRAASKKEDALYNKSFFSYRQKNTIKANQKQLKDRLKILEEKLSNYNRELHYQMSRAQQKDIQIYDLRKNINNCHSQEERLKKYIDRLSYQGENYRENIENLKEENSFLSQQNNKLFQRIRQSQIQLLKIKECIIRERKMKEQLKQKLYSQRENHESEKQKLARQMEQLVVENKNKIETLQSSNKMEINAREDTIFDYTSRILKLQQQLKQKEQIYEGNCEKLSQILQAREMEIQSLRKSNKDYWDRLSSLQQRYDDEAAMKRVLHRTVDTLNRASNQNRNLINELREENKKLLQKTAEYQKQQNLDNKNKGFFSSLFK